MAGSAVDDQQPLHTRGELARMRPLVFQLFAWLAVYLVTLALVRLFLDGSSRERLTLVPAALLPMAPAYLAIRAAVRLHERLDEFQQQVQLRALAFAFVSGLLLCTAYGLLQSFAGLPTLPWTLIAPLFLVLWVYAYWRYGRIYL